MANSFSLFDISGQAMHAQMTRLRTVASNLANANTVASRAEDGYRALRPNFRSVYDDTGATTVLVDRITPTNSAPVQRYEPGHPLANADGYVFGAAVNSEQEMVEMLDAARQYQNNVEVMQTAKSLMLATLRVGS